MSADPETIRQEALSRLISLLESIDGSKVTLIGDTMLDRYHHGFANNLNSTAPVPVLKILDSEESPGASAHIAIGLTSFGMDVSFHTAIGDDAEASSIITQSNIPGFRGRIFERKLSLDAHTGKIANSN